LSAAVAVAACSGSSSSGSFPGSGGDGGGGADGTTSGDDAAGGGPGQEAGGSGDGAQAAQDSGGSTDGSAGMDAGGGGDGAVSSSDAGDAGRDAQGAPCPNIHGVYSITAVEVQGCGSSFNMSAPQCIRQTSCGIVFASSVPDGGMTAINGDATLQVNGTFSGAALSEGTLNRTGCTGTWDGTSSLTVDCGGTSSSQACVLVLQRTGNSCP
jgi:hypothetical protein